MKIDMNKDFEQEFPATFALGLPLWECAWAAAALAVAGVIAVVLCLTTEIPINVAIYLGIPAMFPIAGIGFYKHQGTRVWELIQEIRYMYATRELPFEAEERKGKERVFTMCSRQGKENR